MKKIFAAVAIATLATNVFAADFVEQLVNLKESANAKVEQVVKSTTQQTEEAITALSYNAKIAKAEVEYHAAKAEAELQYRAAIAKQSGKEMQNEVNELAKQVAENLKSYRNEAKAELCR